MVAAVCVCVCVCVFRKGVVGVKVEIPVGESESQLHETAE